MSKDLKSFSGSISNSNLKSISASISNSENNGGKTGYYDLPLPDRTEVMLVLRELHEKGISIEEALNKVLALCPQTLNDLIEYKNMKPWQHEVFKATYAIEDRALKNPKKGSSKIREINKIRYYADRGLDLAVKESNK